MSKNKMPFSVARAVMVNTFFALGWIWCAFYRHPVYLINCAWHCTLIGGMFWGHKKGIYAKKLPKLDLIETHFGVIGAKEMQDDLRRAADAVQALI